MSLREFIAGAKFERAEQFDGTKYAGPFAVADPRWPQTPEVYRASFAKSPIADKSMIAKTYQGYIRPRIVEDLGFEPGEVELIVYRMTAGDHFRAHRDDYAGRAGFVYYLSLAWRWDWGGLLLTKDGDNVRAELPEWNTLVIFDHRGAPVPHIVTPVAPWALEPRYMLVGLTK
jgi:Rps23 Pro-64 3,4-dihydroxylase Tpa1-like proline 4-hydroxylase